MADRTATYELLAIQLLEGRHRQKITDSWVSYDVQVNRVYTNECIPYLFQFSPTLMSILFASRLKVAFLDNPMLSTRVHSLYNYICSFQTPWLNISFKKLNGIIINATWFILVSYTVAVYVIKCSTSYSIKLLLSSRDDAAWSTRSNYRICPEAHTSCQMSGTEARPCFVCLLSKTRTIRSPFKLAGTESCRISDH